MYAVRTEAMVGGFHCPLNGEFDRWDTPDTPYILVLDEEGYPVGTCRIHYLPELGVAKIERVCVLERCRGTGIGRLVIEEAENWIRERVQILKGYGAQVMLTPAELSMSGAGQKA